MAHSIGPTELNQSRKRKDTIGAMESSFELHGRQRKQFRSNALHISQKGAALRDTIFQTFVYDFKKSEFDKTPHEFLPINVLDGIFDYDIETEVGHQRLGDDILELIGVDPTKATEDDHELTQFIMHDARTILFIGIYIDHPSLYNMMLLFKEFSFTDASLPITWDPKRWREEANKHPLATMEHKFGPQSSNIWPLQCMHKFQRDQWRFLPATISCARNSHDFGQRILPFIEKSAIYHGGAHGYVQAYKIHPAHVTEASNLVGYQYFS